MCFQQSLLSTEEIEMDTTGQQCYSAWDKRSKCKQTAMRAETREERLILSEETENTLMGRTQFAVGSAGLGLMTRMREEP